VDVGRVENGGIDQHVAANPPMPASPQGMGPQLEKRQRSHPLILGHLRIAQRRIPISDDHQVRSAHPQHGLERAIGSQTIDRSRQGDELLITRRDQREVGVMAEHHAVSRQVNDMHGILHTGTGHAGEDPLDPLRQAARTVR
jgi:hypothetical protein